MKLQALLLLVLAAAAELRVVPSGGNPCLNECDLAKGGNPGSRDCAACCRIVRHEIPWNCDDPETAADSCKGEWQAVWWDIPSKDNFMHACAACCGECSQGFAHGCGPCVAGEVPCYCGGCHVKGDKETSCHSENSTCVCPHTSSTISDGPIYLFIALIVVGGLLGICLFFCFVNFLCRRLNMS